MQLVINVKDGATAKDIAAQLRFQAGLLEGLDPKIASATNEVVAEKPARSRKAKVQEPQENFDLEASESEDLEPVEAQETGFDEEVETPKIAKKEVIACLQNYSKKTSRDKAIAIVKKFAKSGNVNDVTEADYAKLLKSIGV